MAPYAGTGILPEGLGAARNAMRIVASGALQLTGAFQEAARLFQAVNRTYGFELTVMARAGRVIEMNGEID
jgi:hypothetical protein